MSVEVEQREIEIDPHGDVASDVAHAAAEEYRADDFAYIQRLTGDIEDIEATVTVMPPVEVLAAANESLVASGLEGVPDDPDAFGVLEVDIAVGEPSTITIEVYE